MRISVAILQHEHAIIRQALEVLDRAVRNLTEERMPDLRELLEFLVEFVERFHLAKEEQVFFPLAAAEFPRCKQEVVSIMDAHDRCRELLADAEKTMEKGGDALVESVAALRRYLESHIRMEEERMFPLVDEGLSLAQDERIDQAYLEFMAPFGDDYHQEAKMLVNDLQHRLLGPGYFDRCIY